MKVESLGEFIARGELSVQRSIREMGESAKQGDWTQVAHAATELRVLASMLGALKEISSEEAR